MPARLKLRVEFERGWLGHGKIELLEQIARTGSLAEAARSMQMSYKRAWELLTATNQLFTEPVSISLPGRNVGSSTQITAFGKRVVLLYRAIEKRATRATNAAMQELSAASRTSRHTGPAPTRRRA